MGDLRSVPRAAMWSAEIGATLELLDERAPGVAQLSARRVREEYPTYAAVEQASLLASQERNVSLGIRVVRERRRATRDELQTHARVGAERADARVPIEDMLSAFSLSMGVIRDRFVAIGAEAGADGTSLLEATRFLWTLTEDITLELAVAHRDAELAIARTDERQRAEFLRHLLFGSLGGAELHRRAPSYGLQLGKPYLAIRARPAGDTHVSQLRRAVERAGSTEDQRALVGILEDDVVGVVARPPHCEAHDAVIGVGPGAGLAAMEPSYATASRIVEVARRFGLTGTHTLRDVSIRAAVAAEDEIGDLLVAHCLEPLEDQGDFGATLRETLRVYLKNGMRLKRTALALGIHDNTLRYRLRRYEEIVGIDLVDTEMLFEIWWALERRRVRDAGPQHTDGVDARG